MHGGANGYPQSAAQDEGGGRLTAGTPTTVVAIDRDKNSMQALKWAVDHLIINNPSIVLLHVRTKPSNHSHAGAEGGSEAREPNLMDTEMTELFLPFRAFCARRGLHVKELVVEDCDITKALIEYIVANQIHNIVVGASNRNAITRKFRNPDVPSSLNKSAPEFCAVYVISKGKPMSVRSAKGPPPANGLPPRQPSMIGGSQEAQFGRGGGGGGKGLLPPVAPSPERRSFEHNADFMRAQRDRPLSTARTAPSSILIEGVEQFNHSRRPSSQDSFMDEISFGSADFGDSLEFSSVSLSNESTSPVSNLQSQRDLEAEMRRLRLELKQTMDMYSTACREAISAKQKARELHQWKMEEARKFEEARQAEEAALAMVEMEKAKSRAAMETAVAARRIAELEARKRLNAEMKARRESEEKQKALEALSHNDVRYRKYTIEEIDVATNHFADNMKIGEGGYGPVYRGSLDHTPVAIKVLRPDAQQGKKQFHQEVEVLSCIRHPNMVLLLGACPEYGCLVYEFMENGSLEDRLFRRGGTPTIPWPVRFKIAAEVATALLFLHQTKPEPLVHRDLKPANILLDRNYVSKISDVGLARLVPPSVADQVTQYRMTSAAGTFCYIDPEYQQTGMLGIKSDVYSLGVMLLQIVTAKPPMGLTHHVERAIDKGKFTEMLDPAITDWPSEEALAYAKLALRCSELRKKDRPDLGTVVLPELNRLRNLGMVYEANRNNDGGWSGGGGIGGGGCGPQSASSVSSGHQRSQSPSAEVCSQPS